MELTAEELKTYRRDGVVLREGVFAGEELDALCAVLHDDGLTTGPHVVREDDGSTLRAVYASHLRQPMFDRLLRAPRMLGPARQIAGTDDLYVYQLKINVKPGCGGESWAWHQDYIVWRDQDEVPTSAAVNVAVFLDDVTEFNGPVIFLRGSHRLGTLERRPGSRRSDQHIDPGDYAIAPELLAGLAEDHEMISPKASRGAVVVFHPEIIHGSAMNMAPYPRRLLVATYNPIANAARNQLRPEYLVGRDLTPLPIDERPLLDAALATPTAVAR